VVVFKLVLTDSMKNHVKLLILFAIIYQEKPGPTNIESPTMTGITLLESIISPCGVACRMPHIRHREPPNRPLMRTQRGQGRNQTANLRGTESTEFDSFARSSGQAPWQKANLRSECL
jgi:hypothetical protein